MNKKQKNRKRRLRSAKRRIRGAVAAFFAANILLSGAFALACGVSAARRGSEKVWTGQVPEALTRDDLNNYFTVLKEDLYYLYNHVKIERQFKNIY